MNSGKKLLGLLIEDSRPAIEDWLTRERLLGLFDDPTLLAQLIERADARSLVAALNGAFTRSHLVEAAERDAEQREILQSYFARFVKPRLARRGIEAPPEHGLLIVVLTDLFGCVYCRKADAVLAKVVQAYPNNVRVAYWPLGLGEPGQIASVWYEALVRQRLEVADRFVHLCLDATRPRPDEETPLEAWLLANARAAGADPDRLLADVERLASLGQERVAEVQRAGMHLSVPNFLFANGVSLRAVLGAVPEEEFKTAIEAALREVT